MASNPVSAAAKCCASRRIIDAVRIDVSLTPAYSGVTVFRVIWGRDRQLRRISCHRKQEGMGFAGRLSCAFERGPYTLEWLEQFLRQAGVGIAELGIVEHLYRFVEASQPCITIGWRNGRHSIWMTS